MTEQPPIAVRACVFDAYGTLFDFASAAASCRAVPQDKAAALTALWRDKQLQYTWLRGLQGLHADFWQVTGDALDFALATQKRNDPALRARLMNLYLGLSAYPEVPTMLQRLKAGGMKLAILSNGTPAMLAAAVSNAGLDGLFDAVLSVEEVGVYKPHPAVYRLAPQRLDVAIEHACFLSSNGWDAYSAKAMGYRVLWCNRFGQAPERIPATPDAEISDLSCLPDLLLGAA